MPSAEKVRVDNLDHIDSQPSSGRVEASSAPPAHVSGCRVLNDLL